MVWALMHGMAFALRCEARRGVSIYGAMAIKRSIPPSFFSKHIWIYICIYIYTQYTSLYMYLSVWSFVCEMGGVVGKTF
jgi:hypothetical protein